MSDFSSSSDHDSRPPHEAPAPSPAEPQTYHSDDDAASWSEQPADAPDRARAAPQTYHSGSAPEAWSIPDEPAAAPPSEATEAKGEMQTSYWATPATATIEAVTSVELTPADCRVLGALIEKSFLTPDVYPMTTNGLVTACNQKTNRDPVVSYSAVDVDAALIDLRQRNLVRRVHSPGSRSTKHRHTLDEALSLDENELAVMSVLMLRGPQTVGELRLRTERHVSFESLEATDACLLGLAERPEPLVVQLARKPGHKEARWQHLIGDDDVANSGDTAAAGSPETARAAAPATAAPVATVSAEVENRIEQLEAQVATLQRQLASLANQLGETLD